MKLLLTGLSLASDKNLNYIHPAVRLLNAAGMLGNEEEIRVVPYLLNLLALKLLLHEEGIEEVVKNYMDWYIRRLNYPDRFGLTGTIYDYLIKDGRETALEGYDSVDSYSATFLILTYLYVIKSGDIDFFKNKIEDLKNIAYTIVYLQDKDGLVKALPNQEVKYLVDNVEDIYGLTLFSCSLLFLGDSSWEYYLETARSIKKSVERELYDPVNNKVAWAKDKVLHWAGSELYPDTYARVVFSVFKGGRVRKGQSLKLDFYQRSLLEIIELLNTLPCLRLIY